MCVLGVGKGMPEFRENAWYRIKVVGEARSTVCQCVGVKKKGSKLVSVSFFKGYRITELAYQRMLLILAWNDIAWANELSPRYIEMKTKKISKCVVEEYWSSLE